MKKGMLLWSSFFLLSLSVMGLGAERLDPVKTTASGVGNFGFELFKSIYATDPKDPVAVSPISIAEAVTLATYGSEKETRKQLESLFLSESARKLGADVTLLSYGLGEIRKSLKEFAEKSNGVFEYQSANSIWANNNPGVDFKFKASFVKTAKKEFEAETKAQDFAELIEVKGEKVQKTVLDANQWVSNVTKKKIEDLLSKLSDDDVAIILNAVYAKGKFKGHFSELEEGSYLRDGAKEADTVTYMTKHEDMGVFEDKNIKAFSFKVEEADNQREVPRDQIALDILVPKSGKLSDLAGVVNGAYYDEVIRGLEAKTVNLTMPAGKVEQTEAAKLKDRLTAAPFSVTRPFSDADAQFGLLGTVAGDLNLFINDILTKTFYEVTPFGFEAAAATAVIFARESAVFPVEEPLTEKIDSASLHVIRHIPSGLPLFIVEYDSPVRYSEDDLIQLIELGNKAHRRLQAKVEAGTLQIGYDEATKTTVLGVFDEDYKLVRKIKTIER